MGIHTNIPQPKSEVPPVRKSESASDNIGRIEMLLALEAQVRQCTSLQQLQFLIANQTAKLIPARQIIVASGHDNLKIKTISSLATLDRTSPTMRWLEKTLSDQPADFTPTTDTIDGKNAPGSPWPFCHRLRIGLQLNECREKAQLVLMSEKIFSQADEAMAARLGDTYAHAWRSLSRSKLPLGKIFTKKILLVSCSLILVAMFIPVTLTVLAPVEIISKNPIIVAAPFNGVIGAVRVNPNQQVKAGELLFEYTPTDLTNALDIADRSAAIAQSRYRRASQDALGSGGGRREMAELKLELDLANSKLNYARKRLKQSHVRAEGDGVVLFADKDDWIGKPVITGEKIMKIATPLQSDFLIKLPIGDAVILEDGSQVRVFLDADPLNPISAKIIRKSYHARHDDMKTMSYKLIAHSNELHPKPENQRIGLRGTAQLFGAKVPLAMFLFRKPLSAARQYFGL